MTLDQLKAFATIAESGGFQAAAKKLRISQPALSVAIKKLEAEYGFDLFDRESYRAKLTPIGEALLQRAKYLLGEIEGFSDYAKILAQGEESELTVAIVESAPFGIILEVLSHFFSEYSNTKLKISCEGVRGAHERLYQDVADIALTAGQDMDPNTIETIELGQVILVPVVAKKHPAAKFEKSATERQMQDFVQVIIRDTSTSFAAKDFGVVKGATASCTVNDQDKKKAIIMAGLGWGRLPHFMIQNELNEGTLVSLESTEIRSVSLTLVAARKCKKHGPVAEKLWSFLSKLVKGGKLITP